MKTLTKITDRKLISLKTDNKLRNYVIDYIITNSAPEDRENFIHDILIYGCISGIVRGLIYYSDTTDFYNRFKAEIFELATEQAEELRYMSATEMFSKLNGAEKITSIEEEENLRAWFGFEEMTRIVANDL